jgi:TRAP-type C4-dicarboxylate transport system permease large subunit
MASNNYAGRGFFSSVVGRIEPLYSRLDGIRRIGGGGLYGRPYRVQFFYRYVKMNFMLGITDNPVLILIFINGILLVSGMFLPPTPGLIMLVPILLPVIKTIGVDPIHFGIIACTNLAIGVITPPVGTCLFILCAATGIRLESLTKAVIPFIVILIIALLLITFIPAISLFLPNLLL